MRNNILVYPLLLLVSISALHCTSKQLSSDLDVDIDQLYAVQYNNSYKDSLAQSLAPQVEHALNLSNTVNHRRYIDSTLRALRWTLDSVHFKKLAKKSVQYARNKRDLSALARTYNTIGVYYHDSFQLDSTYYYYIKTEKIYTELKQSIKIGETQFYQARLLFEMGLHMESESKVSQALIILNKEPQNPVNFEANQLLGLCLMERKEYTEAEKYLKKAVQQILLDLEKYKILDDKRAKMAIANAYGNLAEVSYNQRKFAEAKAYVLEGQKYLESDSPIMLVAFLRSTLAQCNYRLTGNNAYIQEVRASFTADSLLNNHFRMHYTAMSLAQLYHLDQKPKAATAWATIAFDNATIHRVLPQQVEALEFLLTHDDYHKKEQVKELIQLRQALTQQENKTRNTFARIAYETESIDAENNKLKELILTVVFLGVGLLFILLFSVFRFQLKIKNKELQLVKAQRKANESINELIIERNLLSIDVKKNERNRIAKDLHDGVVNTIFAIRFQLQLLDTPCTTTKSQLIHELEKLEHHTRAISHSLVNNTLFNENQFAQVVTDLASFQINAWNTQFSVNYDHRINFERWDAHTQVSVFFILQEAIQNVNKYSKATLCTLVFQHKGNKIKLIIHDNGIGFEKNEGKGLGISNMFERAEQLQAEMTLTSKHNQGTTLTLLIPFIP